MDNRKKFNGIVAPSDTGNVTTFRGRPHYRSHSLLASTRKLATAKWSRVSMS